MKKSELKQLIKEKIQHPINEQSFMQGMKTILSLTPDIESKIQNLKDSYPKHEFRLTPNSEWKPERKDLYGTYTFSYYGPKDEELKDLIKQMK
jgi:hypothetical protein